MGLKCVLKGCMLILIIKLLIMLVVICLAVFLMVKIKKSKEDKAIKKSGIRDIDRMNDVEFIGFLKLLFKDLRYDSNDQHENNSQFGADVVLEGDGRRVVLKAIRYGHNARVGVQAVQAIYAAKAFHNADDAWVITNSVFTENAEELSGPCEVKLVDRKLLQELILSVNPESGPRQIREDVRYLFEEAAWERLKKETKGAI